MKRRRLNAITFDPGQQPGQASRYATLSSITGPSWPFPKRQKTFNDVIVRDVEDPDVKFKNMQSDWVNPQRILRKKGFNPF